MTSMTSPLKWHGGKAYLAKSIVALMPPHTYYVEPFAGGLSVLLQKDPEDTSELVNDLNGDLVTFWRVLRGEATFARFVRQVEAVPFARTEWDDAGAVLADDQADAIARAVSFFVRCRQSLAGRMDAFAPPSRTRTRRGMNEQVSAWIGAVDGLPAVHARLRRVFVEHLPALEVIRREDAPGTLFYLDPPYLPDTRSAPAVYRHEMTVEDHRELLDVVLATQGMVMISGYPNTLYDEALAGWTRYTFDLANHAASGASKRRMTEVLWCNFTPSALPSCGAAS